jgi:ferritin-like protein
LLGGLAGEHFTGTAAADAVPDGDLAYARLLVGAELLASDFYARAIKSKRLGREVVGDLRRARANEQEHYRNVSGILSGAGQTPAVAADFEFSYPKGSFASRRSIAKLGVTLETTFLGAYLGAVAGLQTDALREPMARIAANEAQHLSVFRRLAGLGPIGTPFPRALAIDEASNALDAFTS